MVNLKPFAIVPLSKLRAVTVHPSQQIYVGTTEQFIDSCEWGVQKLVAFKNGQIIGYLKVDFAYSNSYYFASAHSVGLRTVVIGEHFQAKGLGQAMLQQAIFYVQSNYPAIRLVYLTVNLKNSGAYRCYQRVGFKDSGELFLFGGAGPQHIMHYRLDSLAVNENEVVKG